MTPLIVTNCCPAASGRGLTPVTSRVPAASARAAAHEARAQHEHQRADDQQQHREFPHADMVGLQPWAASRCRQTSRWRWNSRRADAITLDRFGALDLRIDTKPDLTPVTDADQAVEGRAAHDPGPRAPRDHVLGEEYGGAADFRAGSG
jgi:hypothetical protein